MQKKFYRAGVATKTIIRVIIIAVAVIMVVVFVRAYFLVPAFKGYRDDVVAIEAKVNVSAIAMGAMMYYTENRSFPVTDLSNARLPKTRQAKGERALPETFQAQALLPPWSDLKFDSYGPIYYQYTYLSGSMVPGEVKSFIVYAEAALKGEKPDSCFSITGSVRLDADGNEEPVIGDIVQHDSCAEPVAPSNALIK